MPAEVRYVIFHLSEVLVAINEYWVRRKIALPVGDVTPSLKPDSLACVVLTVAGDEVPEHAKELIIEGNELAAALILFCRSRKIPLPATADKSLTVVGEHLGLVLSLVPDGGLFEDLQPTQILKHSPPATMQR